MKSHLLTKTRDLITREKTPSFLRELDLYFLEDGILIGASGALGVGFKLEGRDLLLQSDSELSDFERKLARTLRALPEGTLLHFIVRSHEGDEEILKEYGDSIGVKNQLTERLVQAKVSHYEEHPFLKREIFLFIVREPSGNQRKRSIAPDFQIAFGKKAHALSKSEFEQGKEMLLYTASEVVEGLRALSFSVEPLLDRGTLKYLYEFLNPTYAKEVASFDEFYPKALRERSDLSLRSKLLLSGARLEEDSFYLDGFSYEGVNLFKLPSETSLKSLKAFEQELGKNYFLSLTLEVPDQEREKGRLKRERNFAATKSFFSRSKDHDALEKASEADELLTELAGAQDKLFYVSLHVLFRDKKKDLLEEKARQGVRAFRSLGDSLGVSDHMNHDRLFTSCLPLQGRENPISFLVRGEQVTHFLPIQSSWRGTEKVGLLLKTHRDEPLRLDLFDRSLASRHSVMVGSTGSGKSFFTNHLLLHFFMESINHDVIVIDLGGSYRKLARVLEGAYLEVECSEEFAFNPFPRKEVLFKETGEADATFLQFLKELLEQMIAPKHEWSASEKMILEHAIREVYAPLSKDEAPLLGDLETCLKNFKWGDQEDREKAYRFAKELTLFTEGEYGKILNRPGRFDVNARFTVFDLRKISQYPELQEILLLVIPFSLKRKFENLNARKLLVLDECWELFKDLKGRELVELFYRTARKFNGAVLSISQNPEDFLKSEISSVMINLSHVKYVLRLKEGHEKLSSFGFNENEIRACRELDVRVGKYSELFIKFDREAVVAKLEPSPLEYWISTTDPSDLAEEARFQKEGPHRSEIEILEELAKKFPRGVQKAKEPLHV